MIGLNNNHQWYLAHGAAQGNYSLLIINYLEDALFNKAFPNRFFT
jgi:hypothetical protein